MIDLPARLAKRTDLDCGAAIKPSKSCPKFRCYQNKITSSTLQTLRSPTHPFKVLCLGKQIRLDYHGGKVTMLDVNEPGVFNVLTLSTPTT